MKISTKIFAAVLMLIIGSQLSSAQSLVKQCTDGNSQLVASTGHSFDVTLENVDGNVNVVWNLPVANMEGYYITERSDDGIKYNQLVVKHFVNVPANSKNILAMKYTYVDKTPATNTVYYRFTKSTQDGSVIQEDTQSYTSPSLNLSAAVTDLTPQP